MIRDNQLDVNKIWKQEIANITSGYESLLIGQIPLIDQCEMWKCTGELQQIAHIQSEESLNYMQLMGEDEKEDQFRGPDWHDELPSSASGDQGEIKQQIQANDPNIIEEVQMLNDLAADGDVDAQLTLFNMYLQGAPDMGIDRNPALAQHYYDQVDRHIQQHGMHDLNA